jgi:acetylornithine deacetylase/succinyl-diaminopimelate desuccinylase-like protein
VAFGPGSIAQAHTKDEFITATALTAGGEAFLQFLTSAKPEKRSAGRVAAGVPA